ncbi:MAG: V-type ATPase 116kDa subunit family protein [Nocardioidaceae bacterium]
MPWREVTAPVRMQRVALVAATADLRGVLVGVAGAGTVDLDPAGSRPTTDPGPGPAGRLLQGLRSDVPPAPLLAPAPPDLAALRDTGRTDLIAGEAELESYARGALVRDDVAALAGWISARDLPALADRLAHVGGAAVPLPLPAGQDPPTLLRGGGEVNRAFSPLVGTYATVPYRDLDPTLPAGLAYVLMFGMMFGDVGHGALLVLAGLLLRWDGRHRFPRLHPVWPFVVAAGVAAMCFGLLYGECFGPTGLVPVLWLSPLDAPVTLLEAALGVGAVLLSGSFVLGTANRWREGGWPLALSAPSGIAGAGLFAGMGVVVLGAGARLTWAVVLGALLGLAGMALAFVGFLASAGGGAAGVTQAAVELFDAVLRTGTNLVSFARLAAFGLTHAALGLVVWQATVALWGSGGLLAPVAVLVFLLGNALTFGLEALVAGIQALRLEYYELFSRVFTTEGRLFRPWRLRVADVDLGRTP